MLAYDEPISLVKLDSAAAPQRSGAAGYSVFDLVRTLWTRKGRIVVAGLVVACAAVLIGKSLTPKYVAIAQLYVDPRELQLVERELTPRAQDLSGLAMVVESQARVITSNSVLHKVIEDTRIDEDPEFGGASETIIGSLLSHFGIGDKLATDANTVRTATIDALNRHITVRRTDRTFIVDIEVWSYDPTKAAMLANAISAAYLAESKHSQATAARRATADLSGRLKELQERLRVAENNLSLYKAQNNFVGTHDTMVSDQQLSSSTQRLVVAHALMLDAQAKYDQIEASRRGAGDTGAITEALQSPTMANLRAQYAEARRRHAELSSELGPLHPALRTIEKQVEDLRRSISEEINRFALSAKNDLTRGRELEASLRKTLDEQKRQSVALSQASVQLRELEREVEASRNIYQSFLKRSRETEEQEALNTSSARIIGEATAPQRRTFPPAMSLLALIGFVLGAFGTAIYLVTISRARASTSEMPKGPYRRQIAEQSANLLTSENNEAAHRPAVALRDKPLITRLQETDVVRTLNGTLVPQAPDVTQLDWPTLRAGLAFTPFLEAMRQLRATVARRARAGTTPVMILVGPTGSDDRVIATLNIALAASRDGSKVLIMDADHVDKTLSHKVNRFPERKSRFRNWFGGGKVFRSVDFGNGITIQPLTEGSEAMSSVPSFGRAIVRARSSGDYNLIIVHGPPMPWGQSDRELLEIADGLVAVLPVRLDINNCMEEIIDALNGMERRLVGVILNEVHAGGTNPQRQKQYA